MTQLTNRDDLAAYLDFIFGYIEADGLCVALRGTGEKGTDGEGSFVEPIIVPMPTSSFDVDRIFGHIQRWSQYGRASFIVPAAIDGSALSDKHATEDRVKLLTTIVVDIDKGNTAEKLAYAQRRLGEASMVVFSGGITETGQPKLHAYWRLSEASDRVAEIAAARKILALKVGGDAAFGRSTQVIRIPGSVYAKGGAQKPCHIANRTNYEYDLDDLLSAIADMEIMEGVEVDSGKLIPHTPLLPPPLPGGGINFSGFKDRPEKEPASFTEVVHEGGDADKNRWSELGRVAGTHIAWARQGKMTLEDAKGHVWTWAGMYQDPPFPPARLESEWKNLVALDVRKHGPMPRSATSSESSDNGGRKESDLRTPMSEFKVTEDLSEFSIGKWAKGTPPKRRFLVDGFVMAGKAHMLAAEPGAGKTFLLLDLALKIASHRPGRLQNWCGLPLTDDAGGTVVMLTTEDDQDELRIRLSEVASDDQRRLASDNLRIIPTINIGGAFALVERERGTGRALVGREWSQLLESMRNIKDLKMVVIDTLNTTMHGEENSATIINEYIQAAAAVVCGELGAALVITHHVRKPGANTKIYTAEDMKNSIRGSSALVGAFRVIFGIWHAHDYKERLTQIGREPAPGHLFNFAVVKANNPQMAFGTRAMLRQPSGLLLDITDSEKSMRAATSGLAEAWLVKAIEHAAEQGHPFTVTAAMKEPPNGRKNQLPKIIADMSERDIQELCTRLLREGRIKKCNPKGKTTYNHLDVPTGPLAKAMDPETGGAYRIAEGADFEPPSWEHKFRYHPVEGRIVPAGEEGDRTVKVGSAGGASRAQGGAIAPPIALQNPHFATAQLGMRFSPDLYLNSDA